VPFILVEHSSSDLRNVARTPVGMGFQYRSGHHQACSLSAASGSTGGSAGDEAGKPLWSAVIPLSNK
jgi:hypothetical protein